jgi:hypothetical protein
MPVSNETDDVAEKRLLDALEELVQRFMAAGLRLQHPQTFPPRWRSIGHVLIRPAKWKSGSDRRDQN